MLYSTVDLLDSSSSCHLLQVMQTALHYYTQLNM